MSSTLSDFPSCITAISELWIMISIIARLECCRRLLAASMVTRFTLNVNVPTVPLICRLVHSQSNILHTPSISSVAVSALSACGVTTGENSLSCRRSNFTMTVRS